MALLPNKDLFGNGKDKPGVALAYKLFFSFLQAFGILFDVGNGIVTQQRTEEDMTQSQPTVYFNLLCGLQIRGFCF